MLKMNLRAVCSPLFLFVGVAQLVERRLDKAKVAGSNPAVGTIRLLPVYV